MTREWKPGDVLTGFLSNKRDPDRFVVVEVTANSRAAWGPGQHAVDRDGNGYCVDGIDDARLLVVIDPEDREQVERLRRAILGPLATAHALSDFADALRSLIAPEKPPEPTGLGAVVEDEKGLTWVRRHPMGEAWVNGYQRWASWSNIAVVKVLSEGVPQ